MPPAFTIDRIDAPAGYAVIALAGEIDLAAAGDFRECFESALAEGPRVMAFDLEAVEFMDSSMLKELLRANAGMQSRGGAVVLAGVQSAVERLLTLTGTDSLFVLVPDRAAALAYVG